MKILTTIGSTFSSINAVLDAVDKYTTNLVAHVELQRATKKKENVPVVAPSLNDEQLKLLQEFLK